MAVGYCIKCRTHREMKNPKQVTLKSGNPATRGICPLCGTKVFRIGVVRKKKAIENEETIK